MWISLILSIEKSDSVIQFLHYGQQLRDRYLEDRRHSYCGQVAKIRVSSDGRTYFGVEAIEPRGGHRRSCVYHTTS